MPRVRVPKTERIRRPQQCKSIKGFITSSSQGPGFIQHSGIRQGPRVLNHIYFYTGGSCFCNSIADWLNRTRVCAGLLNLASLSGLARVWCGRGAMGIFLIGQATLPVGIPRASAFLRPSPSLRACPGFSLVLTRYCHLNEC